MPAAALTCPKCNRTFPASTTHCLSDGTPLRADAMAFDEKTVRRGPRSNFGQTGLAASADPDTDEGEAGGREDTHQGDRLIGAQLGDYVIRRRLGEGGMGVVYAGEQPMIGKKVAIKILRDEIARDPVQVKRLLDEARAVNSIRHRGIIDIFNFGELPDGRHYVVMEYLEGEALDLFLQRRGALPVGEAMEILDEMLAALGAGHGAGIIHRDFKPSNVFLVREVDGSHYLKLLDFGLAKQAPAGTNVSAQTHTHMVVGTPEYIAPEQAQAKSVSPRTDIYAAGVVMFEMVTGRLPFVASSPIEWMIRHVEAPAPAPSSCVGGIPRDLDALILKMLSKQPEQRPQSAEIIRRELQRITRVLSRHVSAAEARTEDTATGRAQAQQQLGDEPELIEHPLTAGRKVRPLLAAEAAARKAARPAQDDAARAAVQKRIKPGAAFTMDGQAPAVTPEPKSQSGAAKRRPVPPPDEATLPTENAGSTLRMATPPTDAAGRPVRPPSTNLAVWIAAAAIVLLGLGAGAFFALRARHEPPPIPLARDARSSPEGAVPDPGEKVIAPVSDDTPEIPAPTQIAEERPAVPDRPNPAPDRTSRDVLLRELDRIERRIANDPPRTQGPEVVKKFVGAAHGKVEAAHSLKERKEAAAYLKALEERLYP